MSATWSNVALPRLDYDSAEFKGAERLEFEGQARAVRDWNQARRDKFPETWLDDPKWLRRVR